MLLAMIYKKSYCLLPPPDNGRVERSKTEQNGAKINIIFVIGTLSVYFLYFLSDIEYICCHIVYRVYVEFYRKNRGP